MSEPKKDKLKIVLFPNKNKNAENHPDYQGNVEKDGKKFPVAAWTHETKDGVKYLSGEIDFSKEIPKKEVSANTL